MKIGIKYKTGITNLIQIIWITSFHFLITSCSTPKTESDQLKEIKPDSNSVSANILIEKYSLSNSNEGYEQSAGTKNPLSHTKENITKGKKLFTEYCSHCHGIDGKANAPMIEKEKYPPPPPFEKRLPLISEGQMFHSIYYGKNQMPDNKNDLTISQIWLIVTYVNTLKP